MPGSESHRGLRSLGRYEPEPAMAQPLVGRVLGSDGRLLIHCLASGQPPAIRSGGPDLDTSDGPACFGGCVWSLGAPGVCPVTGGAQPCLALPCSQNTLRCGPGGGLPQRAPRSSPVAVGPGGAAVAICLPQSSPSCAAPNRDPSPAPQARPCEERIRRARRADPCQVGPGHQQRLPHHPGQEELRTTQRRRR